MMLLLRANTDMFYCIREGGLVNIMLVKHTFVTYLFNKQSRVILLLFVKHRSADCLIWKVM